MRKLKKLKLNFDETWEYVQDNLDKTNALSSELLNLINFENGYFFTLLPKDANVGIMHHFKCGWILPPNPIKEYFVDGHKATYSIKKSIRDEITPLILKEIEFTPHLSCVIDDVLGSPTDKYYTLFSDNFSSFYEDEVYLLLNENNLSLEVVAKCLKASASFWHSLCVFTTADLADATRTLTLEKIREICLKTELVMVGAYDGEGYIFWEKNLTNGNKGFFDAISASTQ